MKKMKPEDLRYGNTIQITNSHHGESFDGIWNVTGIHDGGITVVTGHFIPYSEISPIKLTDEWLTKFGFKKEKVSSAGGQDEWAGLGAYSYNGEWLFRGHASHLHLVGYFNTQIQYVHQLENLFYNLTGKDLADR